MRASTDERLCYITVTSRLAVSIRIFHERPVDARQTLAHRRYDPADR